MSERWKSVGDDFASLKDAFKERYDQKEADEEDGSPDSEDVKNALNTIGEGLERLFSSIGDVVRDDEFKRKAKTTMKNLGDAISESVSDISAKTTQRKTNTESTDGADEFNDAPPNTPDSTETASADEGAVAEDIDQLRKDLDEEL
ncbi:MAG: hypothetical protein JJE47_03525 [Acidimicrobiia bacterium]|nr:hypothetical protein [Acidimicrobiia bacterium]